MVTEIRASKVWLSKVIFINFGNFEELKLCPHVLGNACDNNFPLTGPNTVDFMRKTRLLTWSNGMGDSQSYEKKRVNDKNIIPLYFCWICWGKMSVGVLLLIGMYFFGSWWFAHVTSYWDIFIVGTISRFSKVWPSEILPAWTAQRWHSYQVIKARSYIVSIEKHRFSIHMFIHKSVQQYMCFLWFKKVIIMKTVTF